MDSERLRRRTVRALVATVTSLVVFGAWLAHANKDGCWLFWRGISTAIALYSVVWTWFALFSFFKVKGRITLAGLTLLAAVFWPSAHSNYGAAAESRAVSELRYMQSELSKHEYPKTLANRQTSASRNDTAFFFTYTPEYSPDGAVASYMIQATPLSRKCGRVRSFTITDKGDVHYTTESRPANHSDPVL